ncbi:MAG: GNAT family N-acetyltransferase [Rhodobacterales bacterium]|nr:GNAT family N-acetyltransferase [Rhodobacterales bacterium]
MAVDPTIARERPTGADLALLMERHTADMHVDTPPESIHMMDASALDRPDIAFFVLRDAGKPLAMGAYKRIDAGHAEIKSMHVLAEARGRGLSKAMLDHLMAAAKSDGIRRLSLETGSQSMFLPARRLYERAGFSECPPFEGYVLDPNSVFMTKVLA